MENINFKLKHLVRKPGDKKERFIFPAFAKKLPKGVTPCDFDKSEKLIEVEFSDGERRWYYISFFFGFCIYEAKKLLVINEDGSLYCNLDIVGFEVFKEKRTTYWNLIFERDDNISNN